MSHVESTTSAGIRVVTEAMPSMRSATVGLWFQVGSRDEADHQLGCSHFLEHLLFKGTSSRSAREIAETLDEVGGEANAFTSRELTCFYARVLDEHLPLAVEVLADMAVDALNTPDDVEAEREVVLEEIHIHHDSPDDLVHSDLAEVIFDGHPLGIETLGSLDSITEMDRETIHEWYLQTYRPENLVVAAAGRIDHDQVVILVEDLLGDLGRPGDAGLVRTGTTGYGLGKVHVRETPTEQVHVTIGGAAPDLHTDERAALAVLHTLLGGGMSSRLFQEIREQRGLAYTTYSYVSQHTDGGYWGAYAGTTPAKMDEVCKVLTEQLDTVAETLTAGEVARARASMKGAMVLAAEDTGARMTRLGRMAGLGQKVLTVDEALDLVDEVTLDEVREAATSTLTGRSVAVVGPEDTISDPAIFKPYTA